MKGILKCLKIFLDFSQDFIIKVLSTFFLLVCLENFCMWETFEHKY